MTAQVPGGTRRDAVEPVLHPLSRGTPYPRARFGPRFPPGRIELLPVAVMVALLVVAPSALGHSAGTGNRPLIRDPALAPPTSVLGWVNLTRPTGPSLSSAGNLAYDAKDGYAVLFGGTTTAGNFYSNSTWEFHKGVWSNHTARVAPPARNGAMMAYDAKAGYVVLFGGVGIFGAWPNTHVRDDTWTFSGGRWTNVTPAILTATNSPSARSGGGLSYDPACGCLVLFGGSSAVDTWEFHAGAWTNVTSSSQPPARLFPGLAYDGKDGYLVLFGGEGARGKNLNDTWRWSHGSWTQIFPPVAPSSRVAPALAFDVKSGSLVLFGGGLFPSLSVLGDTWTFSGGAWAHPSPSGPPSPRWAAEVTYDPQGGYLVLYGGSSAFASFHDTWRYR